MLQENMLFYSYFWDEVSLVLQTFRPLQAAGGLLNKLLVYLKERCVMCPCGSCNTVYFINYLQVLTSGTEVTYRPERLINYLSLCNWQAHTLTHALTHMLTEIGRVWRFFSRAPPLFQPLRSFLSLESCTSRSISLPNPHFIRGEVEICVWLLCIIPHAKPWRNYQCYRLTLPPVLNWRQWCGRGVYPPFLSSYLPLSPSIHFYLPSSFYTLFVYFPHPIYPTPPLCHPTIKVCVCACVCMAVKEVSGF